MDLILLTIACGLALYSMTMTFTLLVEWVETVDDRRIERRSRRRRKRRPIR